MGLTKADEKDIEKIMEEEEENAETNDIDTIQIAEDVFETRKGVNKQMPRTIDDYDKYDMPSGSGNFLKLEDGDNRIRITTKAMEIPHHDTSKGGKYSTQLCPGKDKCELCKENRPIKFKFAFLVINRKDGKPYVYEAPVTVFRQIVACDTNKEYGDIREYDITISKEGVGRQTAYTIMPSPKKSKLTDEEVRMIAKSGVSLEAAYSDTETEKK